MKLIIIYGPPAVGKLTVAKALAKLTGYKLLHNHLTLDLVASILPWDHPDFFEISRKFRLELFEWAAKENVPGVIFTWGYAANAPDSLDWIKSVIAAVEKHGGEVCFVRLTCDRDEILERVKQRSRTRYRKMRSPKQLVNDLDRWDFDQEVGIKETLTIDNTNLAPKDTAMRVIEHYGINFK